MPVMTGCSKPGCPVLVKKGERFCPKHRTAHFAALESNRPKDGLLRNRDKAFRTLRRQFLSDHPFCTDPFKTHPDRKVIACVLDHITPHRGDYMLYMDSSNFQGLCPACDRRKTAIDHGWSREGGRT